MIIPETLRRPFLSDTAKDDRALATFPKDIAVTVTHAKQPAE